MLTPTLLAAALALPATVKPQETRDDTPGVDQPILMPPGVGLTLYVPRNATSKELMRLASEMTTTQFDVLVSEGRFRAFDRMLSIRSAIGIQGTAEERETLHGLLEDLDGKFGELRAEEAEEDEGSRLETRAIRVQAIRPESAMGLVSGLGLPVNAHLVQETGTVVLRGSLDDVNVAHHMIASADEPLPQMNLVCEVIEAVDAADVGDGVTVTGALAEAFGAVAPGKVFVRRGRTMARTSVGRRSRLALQTELPRRAGEDGAGPVPELDVTVVPGGWDPEEGLLALDACEIRIEEPVVTVSAPASNPAMVQSAPGGVRQQYLSTSLSLRAGQTTVVGSLGGEPLFVVFTATVD